MAGLSGKKYADLSKLVAMFNFGLLTIRFLVKLLAKHVPMSVKWVLSCISDLFRYWRNLPNCGRLFYNIR